MTFLTRTGEDPTDHHQPSSPASSSEFTLPLSPADQHALLQKYLVVKSRLAQLEAPKIAIAKRTGCVKIMGVKRGAWFALYAQQLLRILDNMAIIRQFIYDHREEIEAADPIRRAKRDVMMAISSVDARSKK